MNKLFYSFVAMLIVTAMGSWAPQVAHAQISGSISITSPNGGETLGVGQTYRITWNASSNIDTVSLGYSSGVGSLDWIANNIPNKGYYDWNVNVGNTTNTKFKIDIIGYQTGSGSLTDESDNFFTVNQGFTSQACESCLHLDKSTYTVGETPRVTLSGLPANSKIYWTFYQDGNLAGDAQSDFGDMTDASGNFSDSLATLDDRYPGNWSVIVKVGNMTAGANYKVLAKPDQTYTYSTYSNTRAGYSLEYPTGLRITETVRYPDLSQKNYDEVSIGKIEMGSYGEWDVQIRAYLNVPNTTLKDFIQNPPTTIGYGNDISHYNSTTLAGLPAYQEYLNPDILVKSGTTVLEIMGFNSNGVADDFSDVRFQHLFNSLKFTGSTMPPTPSGAHSVGTNVLGTDGTVYFISTGNTRSPYTSAGAFLSYKFNTWAGVVPATTEDMKMPLTTYTPNGSTKTTTYFIPPRNGSLINDKGTVYLITNGLRSGFTSEKVFKELGYSFGDVYPGDTSFMVTLAPINSSSTVHADGTLINEKGTLYVLKGGNRIGFPSMAVLDSWGYWLSDAVMANSYDSQTGFTGPVQTRMADQLNI